MDLDRRLRACSTGHICDALSRLGYENVVLGGDLRQISRLGLRLVGRAATIEVVPARTKESPRKLALFLDEKVHPGDVVVIAAHGICEYVMFGGRAALRAKMRGAVGAVIDGGVRDVTELRALDFPVYARGVGLHASEGYLEGIRINETVYCAGVKIEYGDWVVGDDTGVVVVPQDVAEEVARLAEEREEIDRITMAEIHQGKTLAATHRHFQDDDQTTLRQIE